jgi:Putative peptidoglycan binding domain
VPRRIERDDAAPRRRRRRAGAAVIEAERGLVLRMLLYSPKDMVAGALAFAAVTAILANALFLQAGRHPAPMFGVSFAIPPAGPAAVGPLPRVRPVGADASASDGVRVVEAKTAESKAFEFRSPDPRTSDSRTSESKAAESKAAEFKPSESKAADPLTNLVKTTGAVPVGSNVMRPPAPIPHTAISGSRRVAAVQRVLTQYGYGQLRPTGTVGSDTQAAIQKFEQDHNVPVTGQISDRLVSQLVAMVGHPID